MTYEPGVILDGLIAQRVMGWTAVGVPSINSVWWYGPKRGQAVVGLPPYSTDVRAAFEVVEHFWSVEISKCDGVIGRYSVSIYSRQAELVAQNTADEFPLAVCLAALSAVEETP